MYRVDVDRNALRRLRRIAEHDRGRVLAAIYRLADDPRPRGVVHLSGKVHRIRVGQYRVIYSIYDQEQIVLVTRVGRREKDTYRDL